MGVWNPYPSGHENDGDGIITAPPPLPPSLPPPIPSPRHTHTQKHTHAYSSLKSNTLRIDTQY